MKKFIAMCVVAMSMVGMSMIGCAVQPISSCPAGEPECGNYCCPNDTQYACVSGQCVLTACDIGYQFCSRQCISITANCCNQATGAWCGTGLVCASGNKCIPIGATDCLDGTFCPAGRSCYNGRCY